MNTRRYGPPPLARRMHRLRGAAYALVVTPLLGVACDNRSAISDETTTGIQAALTTTTQPTPAETAARALNDRDDLLQQIEQLKQQLGNTDPSNLVTRQSLLSTIQAAQDKYAGYLHAPAAAHVAAPAVPNNSAKRAALRAKMSAYDMNDAHQVAAWAELKRNELGQ